MKKCTGDSVSSINAVSIGNGVLTFLFILDNAYAPGSTEDIAARKAQQDTEKSPDQEEKVVSQK